MAKTIRRLKFFTIFEHDKEEVYLREMANKGYHFRSVVFPGIYAFEVGEPQDVVYRLDYPGEDFKREPEYQEMIQDQGWEYVTQFAEFKYYRKVNEAGANLDLFSDRESHHRYLQSVFKKRAIPIVILDILILATVMLQAITGIITPVTVIVAGLVLLLSVSVMRDYQRLKKGV